MERFRPLLEIINSLKYKLILLLFVGNLAAAQNGCSVKLIKRIHTPNGGNAEILQYIASKHIIAAVNSKNHCLDFYKVNDLAIGDIKPIANIKIKSEPTSVAANANLNYVILSRLADANGSSEIIFADLNTFAEVKKISFGVQLDCVSISPNGKWMIAADEAEENSQTEGGIWALNLNTKQPPVRLNGLDELTGINLGILEPEFIAFDPHNKFSAVSCQENDLIVIVDMQNTLPVLTTVIRLAKGAQPDGIAVIRDSSNKAIIAAAEEGEKLNNGKRTGQCVSFYSLENDFKQYELLSRVDVRKYLCPDEPDKRCDPEGIALKKLNGRIFSFVGIERLNKLLILEITNPRDPILISAEDTGSRPEGVIAVEEKNKTFIITADEGENSNGTISIFEIILD
ncbi:MAG: hypothetical protein A2Y12_07780 [Planctomycetes bacterium GWF2_42_9]|nr:MAG: hypothetical protein A2Y12_07780 [Planctomycetes bacterium GWF2_42_9]